jgi:enterochelin esterase-like enzyme
MQPLASVARRRRRTSWFLICLSAGLSILLAALLASYLGLPGRKSTASTSASSAEIQEFEFYSPILGRQMPIKVFVPPGYASSNRRYAVVYMLHGLDPAITKNWEWQEFGIFWQAENRIISGELPPFIIALPQGEQSYWIDHFEGPAWSKYVAQDVVAAVDKAYRTLANAPSRAIGGLSMGADGALQIALNNPGVFGVVGMHSPALRPYEYAAPFYGDLDRFEAYYPPTLVRQKTAAARQLIIELDVGDEDVWLASTQAFHQELESLAIAHVWNRWPGGHDGFYWGDHLPDYLRFYVAALGLTNDK